MFKSVYNMQLTCCFWGNEKTTGGNKSRTSTFWNRVLEMFYTFMLIEAVLSEARVISDHCL
jgi:hypothetical protein